MTKPFFSWRDAVIKSALPSTTKHVLLTLSCHMNDLGESCFPSIATLSNETSLSKRAVIQHIQQAKDAGWIKVSIHGFAGQKWRSHEYVIGIPDAAEGGYPESPPQKKVVTLTQEGGYPDVKKVVTDGNPNTSVNSTVISSITSMPYFDQFWAIYPRKEKKKDAAGIWKRKKLDSMFETIIADVHERMKRHNQWLTGYIPHPTTYLNGERWNDEIVEATNGQGNGKNPGKIARAIAALS